MTVTPRSSPADVLRLAGYLARKMRPWGALEVDDYVAEGALAFYRARRRWRPRSSPAKFRSYVQRCMAGAMLHLRRAEARAHGLVRFPACEKCGGQVWQRLGGATRCNACVTPGALEARRRRAGDLSPCRCGCGQLVAGTWKQGHNPHVPNAGSFGGSHAWKKGQAA